MSDRGAIRSADVLVIGGGMAGSALAANLAGAGRSVVIVEAESHAGYHATGRSAAVFSQTYGGAVVRALSAASRDFFLDPPAGFADQPLGRGRGQLHVADEAGREALDRLARQADIAGVAHRLSRSDALGLAPVLRPQCVVDALFEPGARDIDVDALQQGY